MSKSLQEWLTEGEQLYNAALSEFQQIEAQLDELETKLAAKKAELNQIAQVVGKPPVESARRLTAELIEPHGPNSVPNSPATIARAADGPRTWTITFEARNFEMAKQSPKSKEENQE